MDGFMMIGIMLLVAGFVLAGIEMILPGFGAPGITGGICLVAGIILTADSVEAGITITLIVTVILVLMFTVILALFHMKKIKPPIVLQEELKAGKGYLSSSDLEYLVGKEGTAATDLRPAGKCDIDGIVFDVRSEGSYVAKGQQVKIIRIQGNTLIIKEM